MYSGSLTVPEAGQPGSEPAILASPKSARTVCRPCEKDVRGLRLGHGCHAPARDPSAPNILLHKDGTPVLADFGLARMAGSLRRLTSSGTVNGDPRVHVARAGCRRSHRSSVRPLLVRHRGYEMLTGRGAFWRRHAGRGPTLARDQPMPSTRELRGELSAHIEEVLRRGLAKRPEDRFPTAAAFVAP